jgi:hypothetical protein
VFVLMPSTCADQSRRAVAGEVGRSPTPRSHHYRASRDRARPKILSQLSAQLLVATLSKSAACTTRYGSSREPSFSCARAPLLREQGVGSSNLPAPTNSINDLANR